SQYCLAQFGAILHHNLDKVAVLGGRARFGDTDGTYDRPVRVVFGGRISTTFNGRVIPVREILEGAAAEQLRTALPGYERITWAETVALLAEAWFRRQPWAGSDIKALVIRNGRALTITVCVPAVAGHLAGSAELDDAVTDTARTLTAQLRERIEGPVTVVCNTGNEVLFGKNPAYHVGKVGGWLVDEASRALAEKTGAPCRVAVMWRNGDPYPEPASRDIEAAHTDPAHADVVREVLQRTDWVP
ncbi:methionine adenosyltransferase, partial [Streptomyces sp. DT225]